MKRKEETTTRHVRRHLEKKHQAFSTGSPPSIRRRIDFGQEAIKSFCRWINDDDDDDNGDVDDKTIVILSKITIIIRQ